MRKTPVEKLIYSVFALIVIMLVGSILFYPLLTKDTATFTVTGKERVTSTDGDQISSYYLIFTDNETFKNVDDPVFLKFNSSDLYGKLQIGETYRAEVRGFRVPFLSEYRNIISAEKIEK